MAQFYSLDEAARVLGIGPDELKLKAQQREIRAFQGAGTWQFRAADVDEYARQMGQGSNPDLSLSDLELGGPGGPDILDLSDFQMGAADPDLAPPTLDLKALGGGRTARPAPPAAHDDEDDVMLFDDSVNTGPSSSRIIGMDTNTRRPSDSDVRIVPIDEGRSSDSDVRLGVGVGGDVPRRPSDSDVSLSSLDAIPVHSGHSEGPVQSDDSVEVRAADGESDFELTPSGIIESGLQPDSGSDFELPLLDDVSAEFEATPLKQPSESDVTAIGMGASGINLAKPSDSGINLGALSDFGPDTSGSIDVAPMSGSQVRPAPVSGAGGKAKAPEPARSVYDTDFEVDVNTGDTMHLANSDFDLNDSSIEEGSSEIIQLANEGAVDANAATSMRAAVEESDEGLYDEGASDAGISSDEDADWASSIPAASASPSVGASSASAPLTRGSAQQAEWGGLWIGVLAFTGLLTLFTSFLALDLVRNMYTWRGETPVASGIIKSISGLLGG